MNHHTDIAYDQINFLPDWYRQAESHRRAVRRQWAWVVLMAGGMVGLWWMQDHQQERMNQYRSALQSQIVAAQKQVTEMVKLRKARDELTRQHRLYTELARPVSFSQIAGTLATLMPATISLHEYQATVKQVPLPPESPPKQASGKVVALKRKAEVRTRPIVEMELKGSAPSTVDVANFVGRLSGNDLFQNVKMVHSTEGKIGHAITRDFRIVMEVRLNCNYQRMTRPEVAHVD